MTPTLPPAVPAFVQHESHVQNHIQVQGGSNWDLSRSAVATPVTMLEDPVPVIRPEPIAQPAAFPSNPVMTGASLTTSVRFAYKSVVLPRNMQKVLSALPKGATYVVAGYADPDEPAPLELSEKRSAVVTSYLRKHGKRAKPALAYGAKYPRAEAGAPENQRVEVFVAP